MNQRRAVDDSAGSHGELVLITQSYPYGSYADFLSDEIGFLAGLFDTVTVVPLKPRGSLQSVPSNVSVDLSVRHALERGPRFRALLSPIGISALVDELRAGSKRAPSHLFGRTALAAGQYAMFRRWAATRDVPSVVYTYWLGAPAAALADEWVGTPVVSRAHRGDLYWENFDPPGIPFQRRAIEGSEFVASVSDQGRDYLIKRYPDLADRIVVARLGITRAASTAPASEDGMFRVLSISSLTDVKRPLLMIDVVRELAARVPVMEWSHFGDGPLRDDVARAVADLPDNTTANLHGQTEHPILLEYIGRGPWDVFVNVSSSEGVPVSIMEVLSAGIPVVATDVGGVAEVVDPEMNRLVDADADPAVIADAVLDAVDPSSTGRLSRKASCDTRYSADHNYRAFAERLAALAIDQRET